MQKRFILVLAALMLVAVSCGKKPQSAVAPGEQIQPVSPPVVTKPDYTTASGKPPQFVVMAFDGSHSLEMWQKTLDFSKDMQAKGSPVHFTYFLSGVYFLNFRHSQQYHPPGHPAGFSPIGFGDSNNDVEQRIAYVNRAIAEGHEIGSHLNGHFDGSTFSLNDWEQEFDSFDDLIFNAAKNNGVSPQDAHRFTINLSPSDVVGFRAPDLGTNSYLFTALADKGFLYDTSKPSLKPDAWPTKLKNGIWEFPLAKIPYANSSSSLLSMDYNFYFKQSGAKDMTKKGEDLWNQFYNDTYESYLNYFQKNYDGNRAPVFIGSHFSEWNDGAYWEAMRDFGIQVCGKPEVRCVSFRELMDYMNNQHAK